jgi:hypothetical protein
MNCMCCEPDCINTYAQGQKKWMHMWGKRDYEWSVPISSEFPRTYSFYKK